jgi:hypothetical protein
MKLPQPWIGLLIAGLLSLGSVAWAAQKKRRASND